MVSAVRSAKSGDFGLAPGLGHQLEQQRVVVEHLLEMRHEPALVDAVAGEAAAEMIVDAALRDMGEGVRHRFEQIGLAVAAGPRATGNSRIAVAEISARL